MLRLRVGFSGPVTVGVTKELRIEGIRPVAQVIPGIRRTTTRSCDCGMRPKPTVNTIVGRLWVHFKLASFRRLQNGGDQ